MHRQSSNSPWPAKRGATCPTRIVPHWFWHAVAGVIAARSGLHHTGPPIMYHSPTGCSLNNSIDHGNVNFGLRQGTIEVRCIPFPILPRVACGPKHVLLQSIVL